MTVARYVVPRVPLIPQDMQMSCWYASAQMLIQWRREKTQSTESGLPDPSEVDTAVDLYKADNGLAWTDMIAFARAMGLRNVPPMSPRLEAIAEWLHDYGPIWTAGYKKPPVGSAYGHVVVIVGVGPGQLFIHDPEPMNQGTKAWRPQSWLATTLEVGVFPEVAVNFLHCPD